MKNRNVLLPIFITVFVDLLGLGIVIPVIAPLLLNPANGLLPASASFNARNIVLGLLTAVYPLAQFVGAPMLGALSDRYGRKKLLLTSLVGTFAGYVLFAIGIVTNNLPLLFVSRLIDGFTGGNISVAMSAIADSSDQKSKAKNFGMIGMAFGLGFILGPYIGGKLADSTVVSWFNFSTPFWFAAGIALVNIVSVIAFLPETIKEKVKKKVSPLTGFENIIKAMRMTSVRTMFLVVFLFTFGFTFFTQFFQVYLIEKFSFTQSMIGDLFAYIGVWVALTQGGIVRPLSKKYEPKKIVIASILFLGLSFPLLLFPSQSVWLYAILPLVAIFNGLTMPNTTAIISNLAGEESQGEILGINQSIQSLAQAIPALIAGFIISININLPTIVASVFTILAWVAFVFVYRAKKKEVFHEV